MVNVEVWTHAKMAVRLTLDFMGNFRGTLDLSQEPNGPLALAIYAWNVPPGGTATVSLATRETVFLHHSKKALKIPFPSGANGMELAWSDEFNTLSATPCKPGTGTWPKCATPTASDGFTWYENKPNGGDFGDAAFEHTDSPYNPYTIKNGFLRIRSTYDPNYIDPYGFKRKWRSGLLSTAFPDKTTNVPNLQNGYYEARVLVPHAATGPNNISASGGTWPAFWQMTLPWGTTNGSVEIDTTEQYGNNQKYQQSAEIHYGNATGYIGFIFHGYPADDLTWDFHRHGVKITDATVTYYFDDLALGIVARDQLANGATPQWFLMLDLAMGSGWPINPPPAGYFDMWIDYVRYYH